MLDQTLNTPLHSQVNTLYKNKNENITERLQATWAMFSAKFKDTANELRQEKIHCDKICQNKSNNKTSRKKQCRIQDKM